VKEWLLKDKNFLQLQTGNLIFLYQKNGGAT